MADKSITSPLPIMVSCFWNRVAALIEHAVDEPMGRASSHHEPTKICPGGSGSGWYAVSAYMLLVVDAA